jgi:RIO kinase 1
VQQKSLNIHDD